MCLPTQDTLVRLTLLTLACCFHCPPTHTGSHPQGRVPVHHVARAAHTAQRNHRAVRVLADRLSWAFAREGVEISVKGYADGGSWALAREGNSFLQCM